MRGYGMSKREYCTILTQLLIDGLKAEKEGRVADRVRCFQLHDDMLDNPLNYITE